MEDNNLIIENNELVLVIGDPESLTIPEGVTHIGHSAFSDCRSLKSIHIPQGVKTIGSFTFENCTSLKSLTLPEGLTHIGDSAFYSCRSLKSLTIPEGVTTIGDFAFADCHSLKSLTLPSSLTTIGDWAFDDCTSLRSLHLPKCLTSIGYFAFSECRSLESITLLTSNPSAIDCRNAFKDISPDCKLIVPEGSGEAYRQHPEFGKFKTIEESSELANLAEGRGVPSSEQREKESRSLDENLELIEPEDDEQENQIRFHR